MPPFLPCLLVQKKKVDHLSVGFLSSATARLPAAIATPAATREPTFDPTFLSQS